MNLFNRILTGSTAFVLLLVSLMLEFDPHQTANAIHNGTHAFLSDGSVRPMATLITIVLAAALLIFELWPRKNYLRVKSKEGELEYSPETIQRMIEHNLEQVDGVERVRITVSGRDAAQIRVQIVTRQGFDPQDLARSVSDRISDQLGRLGLAMGALRVSIQEPKNQARAT